MFFVPFCNIKRYQCPCDIYSKLPNSKVSILYIQKDKLTVLITLEKYQWNMNTDLRHKRNEKTYSIIQNMKIHHHIFLTHVESCLYDV